MKTVVYSLFVLMLLPAAVHAMQWQQLEAMRLAMQQQDYRGEYMHRRGDQTSVYSVVHQYRDGVSSELLRQLDGDMIEIVRDHDRVVCYFPQGAEEAAGHAIPAAPFSQAAQLDLAKIAANYSAHSLGRERVAGLMADIIELRSDDWRFRQKLWLDVNTHILLQSEILDADGEVIEQFRFTRLELGTQVKDSELNSSLAGKAGVMQQVMPKSAMSLAVANDLNTIIVWVPSGFELVSSDHKMKADGWVDKRTYSDGLTSYSIYAEPARGVANNSAALATMGATVALLTQHNDLAITVIGEIPKVAAQKIASQIKLVGF